jgi:DGQHR domain-containing protein
MYRLDDLKQIFNQAGIKAISVEGLHLDIVDTKELRGRGKSVENDATQCEFDLFAYVGNVAWFVEWTTSKGTDTRDFDNFKSKVQIFNENRGLLGEAFDKVSVHMQEQIQLEKETTRIIGLYVNPIFTPVQGGTIEARIEKKNRQLMFVWDCDTFEYFKVISGVLRKYSKYDIFTFFHVSPEEVLDPQQVEMNRSKTTYEVIEMKKGVFGCPTYTFKISPQRLLERCYVLRNEGWRSDSFQRMISPTKLHAIRKYIVDNKGNSSFANNIIIGPSTEGERVEIQPRETGGRTTIDLSWRYNSFCIIDGQHRLLAFTQDFLGESNPTEKQADEVIKNLAQSSEVLVTLVDFAGEPTEILEREARLFKDINSLQTRVKKDFIFNLQEIIEPNHPFSIGNKVIRYLNQLDTGVFKNKFQMKSLPSYRGKIKRSSVVQYGLAELVNIKGNLLARAFKEKNPGQDININQPDNYITFCGDNLNSYFRSVKEVFEEKAKRQIWDKWSKSGYMLLSTSAIVGFLRLYRHFIKGNLYSNNRAIEQRLRCITVDFAKDNYSYTSSQWAKLETKMFDDIRGKFPDFGDESLVRRE